MSNSTDSLTVLSITTESDTSSHLQGPPFSSRPSSPSSTRSPMRSLASIPVPPGLMAPLGIPSSSLPPRVATASPQTPLLSSQSSYQMSTAARALLDDVKARREAPLASVGLSPFPDFDRTLQTLSGTDDGGFSFNFDPKFVTEIQASENLGEYDPGIAISFDGPYVDDFPALQIPDLINTPHVGPPPGLQYPANYPIHDPFDTQSDPDRQAQRSYAGTFNPFADTFDDDLNSGGARVITEIDEERKFSRFNFARSRQNSSLMSSPASTSAPSFQGSGENPAFYGASSGLLQQPHWPSFNHQELSYSQPVSHVGSPTLQQSQPQNPPGQSAPRFRSFDADLSEAQLREFIQSSRERAGTTNQQSILQGESCEICHYLT